MLRIAVCDDQEYYRKKIGKHLKDYFKTKKDDYGVCFFESGRLLLEEATQAPFDLIFLDIDMPEIDGIAVGEALAARNEDVFLIFVTAYHGFVREAFRLGAFQYLEKPVAGDVFVEEMDRVVTQYYFRKKEYIFEYKGVKRSIPITEICYLESFYWNIIIHKAGKKSENYKIVGKLEDEVKKLRAYPFVRIHQSFLVNMIYIEKFLSDKVFLAGGKGALTVSRKYKESARKKFLSYQSKVGI